MIGGLLRFVVFRMFGARVLLVLTALSWIWNRLRGRRPTDEPRRPVAMRRRRA